MRTRGALLRKSKIDAGTPTVTKKFVVGQRVVLFFTFHHERNRSSAGRSVRESNWRKGKLCRIAVSTFFNVYFQNLNVISYENYSRYLRGDV